MQGATEEQRRQLANWRDESHFSDAERAAIELTEAVTRLADQEDPVPDAVWNQAAEHYDERQLAALLITISTANVFNRLNVATRQVPGDQNWKS